MSYPLGHAVVGYAVCKLSFPTGSNNLNFKDYAWLVILSSLPDFDVVPGILFYGNGSAFHRGASHSLFFVLIASVIASRLWKPGKVEDPLKVFIVAFLLLLSHLLVDLADSSLISLWWPLQSPYESSSFKSLSTVAKELVTAGFREVSICLACVSVLAVKRYFKSIFPFYLNRF